MAISPLGNVAIGSDVSHDTSATADKLTVAGTLKSNGLWAKGAGVTANGEGSTAMGYSTTANGT